MNVSKMSWEEFKNWWWKEQRKKYMFCEYCEENGKVKAHEEIACYECSKHICKKHAWEEEDYHYCSRKCIRNAYERNRVEY